MLPSLLLLGCVFILASVLSAFIYAASVLKRYEATIARAWGPVKEEHHMTPEGLGPLVYTPEFRPETARVLADCIARVVAAGGAGDGESVRMLGYLGLPKRPIGAVFESNGVVAVCARGTITRDELRNDMRTQQVGYKGVRAHSGMVAEYLKCDFRREALRLVDSAKPRAILLAGHSLGAALVTLLVLDLPSTTPVQVVTFGAPRVGDQALADRIAAMRHVRYYRLVNRADIITDLPPTLTPRVPSGELETYVHAGEPISFFTNGGTLRENHRMATYVVAL